MSQVNVLGQQGWAEILDKNNPRKRKSEHRKGKNIDFVLERYVGDKVANPFHYPTTHSKVLKLEDKLLERDSIKCFGGIEENDFDT